MPPRYSYWTIIAGGLPTAFRAADREELLPTFTRLREKQPDAEMKWFARGKLWDSPEAAREDTERRRARPEGARSTDRPSTDRRGGPSQGRRSSEGARAPGPPSGERRGRDWRPGGEHRDPRQKFKDAKKDRNQRWREEKFARTQGPPRAGGARDGGDRPADVRPREERPRGPRPEWRNRDRPAPPKFGDRRGGPSLGRRSSEGAKAPGPPARDGVKRDWNKSREARGDRPGPPRDHPPRQEWRDRDRPAPPKRDWHKPREGGRPFQQKRFERNQGTEEPQAPPRPRGPNREPRPSETPNPGLPPRPSESTDLSPTPERGRRVSPKPTWNRDRGPGAPKRESTKPREGGNKPRGGGRGPKRRP